MHLSAILRHHLTFYWSFTAVGNAEILRTWGKEGESAMHFLHFLFAFGGIMGPVATEPFLTPSRASLPPPPSPTNVSHSAPDLTTTGLAELHFNETGRGQSLSMIFLKSVDSFPYSKTRLIYL